MNKNKFAILFIVVIIIVFFLMLWYENMLNKDKSNAIKVSSNYKNEIILKDSFPMNDSIGKNIVYDEDNSQIQGYYEFEVESTVSYKTKYEIYAMEQYYPKVQAIHSNYIKVYLTDENNIPVMGYDTLSTPTIYTLKNSNNFVGKRIYSGTLKPGEKKKFILRIWVSDAYSIGNIEKKYGMFVNVEAK